MRRNTTVPPNTTPPNKAAPPRPSRNRDGLLLAPGVPLSVPTHPLAEDVAQRTTLDVTLIGCGGTGSQVLTGLGQIHASLRAMHDQGATPIKLRGLEVTVYDPDTVSPFNVGRQMFYESDIGMYKAEVLVNRVNMAYGTRWQAVASDYRCNSTSSRADFVVSCVDTARSRRDLHRVLWGLSPGWKPSYWLDCANLATVGQVVLGQPGSEKEDRWPRNREFDPEKAIWHGQRKRQVRDRAGGYDTMAFEDRCHIRLPCVTELFPDLLDEGFDETDEPSCSTVDALRKQSLFVNRTVSAYALDLLWELLREGKVGNQGCYFNLRSRTANPIELKVWPVASKRLMPPRRHTAATPPPDPRCKSVTH